MATKPASGTTPASRAAARAAGQPTTYTARKNAGLISGSSGPNLIDASKRVVESKDSQIESITSQAQQIQGAINKLSTETPENIAQPELAQTPQVQPGAPTVPFAQAQQALRSGGAFQGQALTNAENSLADTYRKAGMLANQSGVPAPQGQGAGALGAQQFTGAVTVAPETPSILGGVQEVDSMFDSLFVQFDDFYSPVKQKTSLVEEYSKLSQSLGIDDINAELIDAKRIIEGTEDDIRAEVTATGGMATESQVLALANARNKSLIKNYNYLLDTKNAAMEQLGTMMELTIADREAAAKEFDTKMNFAFKVAEFKERATTNARNGLTWAIENGAGAEILKSPYETRLAEKTLGLPAGSLAGIVAKQNEEEEPNLQSVKGDDGQFYTFNPATGEYTASGMGQPVPGLGQYTEKQLKAITKLNEDVSKNATYAKTTSMKTYADNVLISLGQQTGVGDIAAINQFQKAIDEGAVTRDQDVTLIQSSQSLANSLKTRIKKLEGGQQLSPELRTEMKNAVQKLYDAQLKALSTDPYIKAKQKEAELNGLTLDDTILGELGGASQPTNDQDIGGKIDQIMQEYPNATEDEIMEIYRESLSITIPQSSRLSYVNNNPGNLRFAGQEGAVKGEGGFAKFSNPLAGFGALMKQIALDASRGHTLQSFISKFAPPSENDTRGYIQKVASALGISSKTPIAKIDKQKLAKEIAKMESNAKIG